MLFSSTIISVFVVQKGQFFMATIVIYELPLSFVTNILFFTITGNICKESKGNIVISFS